MTHESFSQRSSNPGCVVGSSSRCFKRTSGGQVTLFDIPRSASPAVTVGPDNTTHFVWESIRSVRRDSNCVAYSSQIMYRSLNSSGQLSTPQLVDTGFSPCVVSTSPNLARILWFRGGSSSASIFSLRYRTISAGIPSPILTLVVYGKSPVGYYQLGLARFVDQTTSIDYPNPATGSFRLNQNFPNPFNPITTMRFEIAERSHVLMTVSDILGREVSRPIDETKSPGAYNAHFEASHLSSGVYFFRLQAGTFVETRKMLLIR